MQHHEWTPEQDALLIRIWPTGESIKRHIKALGDRSYTTIMSHAKKRLRLGPRPRSARGRVAYAWPIIEAELRKHPGTVPELIKRTGLSMAPICHRIREANPGPNGLVHVMDWRKRSTGGKPVAIYAIGPGENAPEPEPFTPAEKWKHRCARRGIRVDPFATASGQVAAPTPRMRGRIYQQPMSIRDDEREAA